MWCSICYRSRLAVLVKLFTLTRAKNRIFSCVRLTQDLNVCKETALNRRLMQGFAKNKRHDNQEQSASKRMRECTG